MNRIIIILILGLGLRLVSLNQSLWIDEATSLLVVRNFSFSGILTNFSPGDFHPPLYYLVLKVWTLLFGIGEVSARALSILFGLGTVWLVYLIGQQLEGRSKKKIAELAALLLATSPLHIYYSQEARMYVPATFFAALLVLFFLKVLKEKSFGNWLGLTLSGVLLAYTDYLPGFVFLALAFYLLLFERRHFRREARKWFASAATVFLLFSPWLPTLSAQFQSGLLVKVTAPGWWKVLGRTNLKELALVPVKFMIGRISSYNKVFYAAMVSVPSFVFAVVLTKSALFWRKTRFLWFWLLVPVVTAAILGLRLSVFSYFRLLFVLPAFYLLLAFGALSFKAKRLQVLAVAVLVLVNLASSGIYLLNPRFHREDWRRAVAFIEENSKEGATTLFVSAGQQEAYRYYAKSVPALGPQDWNRETFSKIWLMRYVQPIFDPQDTLRLRVEEAGYQKAGEYDFNGVVVWEYER